MRDWDRCTLKRICAVRFCLALIGLPVAVLTEENRAVRSCRRQGDKGIAQGSFPISLEGRIQGSKGSRGQGVAVCAFRFSPDPLNPGTLEPFLTAQ